MIRVELANAEAEALLPGDGGTPGALVSAYAKLRSALNEAVDEHPLGDEHPEDEGLGEQRTTVMDAVRPDEDEPWNPFAWAHRLIRESPTEDWPADKVQALALLACADELRRARFDREGGRADG